MKNSILMTFVLLGLLFLSSCSSSDINPDSANQLLTESATAGDGVKIAPGSLPQAITAFISSNYQGQTIIKAEQYKNKYEVTLSSGVKLEYDLNGKLLEISGGGKKSNIETTLPKTILDYIAANHPGATITKAKQGSSKYDIYLSNGYRLKFNLAGVLKEAKFKGK